MHTNDRPRAAADSTDAPPGKRPLTILAGPYGHPLHPVLVTVPIGAWVAGLIFDLVSRFADDPGAFAQGGRWLVGIGVLAGFGAGLVGFLDLMAIPMGSRAFRTGLIHAGLNVTALGSYLVNFLARGGGSVDGPVSAGLIALSAATLALVGVAGFLGGKLAFRYGVRVADEGTQREGFV